MPKAKPVSLWPLSFDEALKKLIEAPPSRPAKQRKPKRRQRHSEAARG